MLPPLDTDNDGNDNITDEDDDADGIVDTQEETKRFDTDNDDNRNDIDTDDDNDGYDDSDEAVDWFNTEPSEDRKFSYSLDTDNDGKRNDDDHDDDADGLNEAQGGMTGGADAKPYNTDNDDQKNNVDSDDDNDGINDEDEETINKQYDTDNDGERNNIDLDDDCDGLNEAQGGMTGGEDPKPYDTDNDGETNNNDENDDNDSKNDLYENTIDYQYDTDNDGKRNDVDKDPNNGSIHRIIKKNALGESDADNDNDGIENSIDPNEEINASIIKSSVYLANREVDSHLFNVDLLTIISSSLLNQKDLGFFKLGYWATLHALQNQTTIEAIQNFEESSSLTATTAFDSQTAIGLMGLDFAFQKNTTDYHLGLIVGVADTDLIGQDNQSHVNSQNQGLSLGFYTLLTEQGSHLALSLQQNWFKHDLKESLQDRNKTIHKMVYLSNIKEAILNITYPLSILRSMHFVSTFHLAYQWYEDDLNMTTTIKTTYQGKGGIKVLTTLNQFTTFIEVNYNFGQAQNMCAKEKDNLNGAQPTFILKGKPIPVNLSIQTGLNYTLENQFDLDLGLSYFKETQDSEVVYPQTGLNLKMSYWIKENIILTAHLEKLFLGNHADITAGIQMVWKW